METIKVKKNKFFSRQRMICLNYRLINSLHLIRINEQKIKMCAAHLITNPIAQMDFFIKKIANGFANFHFYFSILSVYNLNSFVFANIVSNVEDKV